MKRVLISLSLIIIAMSYNISGKQTVDFNYPQEVISSSQILIEDGLRNGRAVDVVNGLMQLSVAKLAISDDNLQEVVHKIDSVAAKESNVALKSLLYSFEAEMLAAYRDKTGGKRTQSTENRPDDISEWSYDQLGHRIEELLDASLRNIDKLWDTPISEYADILNIDENGALFAPNIYCVVANRASQFNAKEEDDNILFAPIIERGDDKLKIYYTLKCSKFKTVKETIAFYRKWEHSEYSGLILERCKSNYDYSSTDGELFEICNRFISTFPKYRFINNVKRVRELLLAKYVNINYREVVSAEGKIAIDYTSHNVDKFKINVYRVTLNNPFSKQPKKNVKERMLVASKSVTVAGNAPFEKSGKVAFEQPLPYGVYQLEVTYTGHDHNNVKATNYDFLRVTDLLVFEQRDNNNKQTFYVLDGMSGEPKDAAINVMKSGSDTPESHQIPSSGKTISLNRDYSIIPVLGGDMYSGIYNRWNHGSYDSENKAYITNINTDLSAYRPGDKLQFAAIVYSRDAKNRRRIPEANLYCEVKFYDANNDEIDSLNAVTDEFGRISGEFKVPEGRMLGNYSIRTRVKSNASEKDVISYQYFSVEVSEFKLPTFLVEFENPAKSFNQNDAKEFKGKIATYSNVPLKNVDVEINVTEDEWSWWRPSRFMRGENIGTFRTKTDKDGRFSITLPDSIFLKGNDKDEEYAFMMYQIEAAATSAGGETRSAATSFVIGSHTEIVFEGNLNIEATAKAVLPIKILSSNENTKICNYSLISCENKKVIYSSSYAPGESTINLSNIASGEYTLKVWCGNENDASESKVTVYRRNDIKSPSSDVLWTPELELEHRSAIDVWCGIKPQWTYINVFDEEKVLESRWILLKAGLNRIAIDSKSAGAGQKVNVKLSAVNDYKTHHLKLEIAPEREGEKVALKIESFRDKIVSGDTEKWKFTISSNRDSMCRAAVLLNIYNKAITQIAPFHHNLHFAYNNFSRIYDMPIITNEYYNRKIAEYSLIKSELKLSNIVLPYFIYEFSFGGYVKVADRMYAGAAPLYSRLEICEDSAVLEENSVITSKQAGTEASSEIFDNVEFRKGDVYNALWAPMLTTDEKGELSLEFKSPTTNSTWVMNAAAYNKNMASDLLTKEFVTSKPVMAECNLPRFVRNGDEASLKATIINASDTTRSCLVLVELFDIASDKIILSQNFTFEIEENGQQVCELKWNVPSDASTAGFRVRAVSGTFSDGEQELVPVLPAVSPLVESEQFYMNPGENEATFAIPQLPEDAKVWLEYCDNPVWSCVKALPSVFNSGTVLSTDLMHTYYALLMAEGVAKSYPIIKTAIDKWQSSPEDSALVSALSKNQNLKIHDMTQSPWLKASQRETLRMMSIQKLFDENYNKANRNEVVAKLRAMQATDGGWQWIKGCGSSYHTTLEILELLGELNHLGYLPDNDINALMIADGVNYIDKKVIEYYNKYASKDDYSFFYNYAYVRRFFRHIPQSKTLQQFVAQAVKEISREWKGTSMANKAYSALLLKDYGHDTAAREIVESIMQYSISTPDKGVYWDNLQRGSGRFFQKTTLTSLMLQAINAVNPDTATIDAVRQWLLLDKQANDWGGSSLAANAIYTLLSTGTNWLNKSTAPRITIGGEDVAMPCDGFLGEGVIDITPGVSGEVKIARTGKNPAWGALIWRYKSPMDKVKAAKSEDLEIKKELFRIEGDRLVKCKEFAVGDKVRVMLTIKNRRDLDYVTITDERCACAEPIDQLAASDVQDDVWLYRETRDSSTNIFINSLNKGTHIVYYDINITAGGIYNMGVASIQCQYSPQHTAHSAGSVVVVN